MEKDEIEEAIKNPAELVGMAVEAKLVTQKIDLNTNTKTRETDPQLIANKFAAPAKVKEGKKLAK